MVLARLLHHCHVVNMKGNSYRLKHYTERKAVNS
ncbi:MAG: ATP-binding protein [Candidatus Omnitrophica bacterium]|nr:ATP-binding protein [Candidatus Omnitrophota bacterium]